MGWMAAAGSTLLSLYGANKQAGAATDAANISAAAAREQTQLQRDIFNQQQANQAPYLAAGTNALAQLREGTAPGGQFYRPFSMADYQADPGYGFRLGEGLKAMSHQAGARGGLISGQTMKGMEEYRQGLASQEYGNAFNRYQTNRANQLQPLGSLMSSGQAAAVGQAAQAGQYGANASNMLSQMGVNTGGATLAGSSAYGKAIGDIGAQFGRKPPNFNNMFGGGVPYEGTY